MEVGAHLHPTKGGHPIQEGLRLGEGPSPNPATGLKKRASVELGSFICLCHNNRGGGGVKAAPPERTTCHAPPTSPADFSPPRVANRPLGKRQKRTRRAGQKGTSIGFPVSFPTGLVFSCLCPEPGGGGHHLPPHTPPALGFSPSGTKWREEAQPNGERGALGGWGGGRQKGFRGREGRASPFAPPRTESLLHPTPKFKLQKVLRQRGKGEERPPASPTWYALTFPCQSPLSFDSPPPPPPLGSILL